jgi:predicted alpha/beta superfamily hydrolase
VLERQLIPFVESRYRADASYRVLGGSSYGGLFALQVLFSRPSLFAAYIVPSPAVDYEKGWLFDHEETFAKSGTKLSARLYMTAAEKEWPLFVDAIKRFDARLRERAYPGLTYEFRVVDGERHAGTKPESYNRGVRFAFAPRAPSP